MRKRMYAILKVLLVLIATVGTVIVLENISMLVAEHKGALVVLKYVGASSMAIIPLLLHRWFTRNEKWPLGLNGSKICSRLVIGSLLGAAFMFCCIILVYIFGGINFAGVNPDIAFGTLFFLITSSFFVSLGEETLFRGSIQGLLKQGYGSWAGILGSAGIFFIIHGTNPAMFESVVPPLNLLLSGIILGLLREKTGSLWIPIGFHWTWNTVQELFGLATSGFESKGSLINISLVPGKEMISGGNFGIEGSIISFIILVLFCAYLLRTKRNSILSESKVQIIK